MLNALKWGCVPDDYRLRIGSPVFTLENESPTTISIYDIECSEDKSIGEEETKPFKQILIRWNLLTPGRSYFIIGTLDYRSPLWRDILFPWRQRG
jgi:hypothetical protein